MNSVKVRLRLAGRRIYEPPVSLPVGNLPPKIGDLIEVVQGAHPVRAQVTSTCSPICKEGDLVTYLVYANELDNRGKPGTASTPAAPVLSIVGLLSLAVSGVGYYLLVN